MESLEKRSSQPHVPGAAQDMRVAVVLGTRPEAIKLSPVILELKRRDIETIVINTGQHKAMVHAVLAWFGIKPDVDLKLMTPDQPLCSLAWKLLERLPEWYRKYKPDIVVVQGDTTTAMAGALAAFYEGFPVAHVEAGLRTYNSLNPFPEEANRRMISAMASYHFAPTQMAADNLLREGIPGRNVFVTGNTGIDALCIALGEKADEIPIISFARDRRMILVTAHRRESHGEPLRNICKALIEMTRRNHDIEVIFPVHPNPNVRKPVYTLLENKQRIYLMLPVSYSYMVQLLCSCDFVLTDSGGIQEEAAYLCKPVLVLRNETERAEGIEVGIAKLIGTDPEQIIEETEKLLEEAASHSINDKYIYGDGHAAERIVDILIKENTECQIPRFQQQSLCATVRST